MARGTSGTAWVAVASVCLLVSCAGLDVEPVGDQVKDDTARGFRYYQSAPFLLVHSDGKGGLVTQIKYLPDTTQKMSVRPYAYLSSNESTLKFDGGVLTQAAATVDETAVPTAALDSLTKVLSAAAKAALNVPETVTEGTVPVPYLFKIIITDNNVLLKGGPAMDPSGKKQMEIRVTLPDREP